MLVHPLGELRRAHQAGLHRDVGEVRGGDDLLVAICRRRETAEHGDDRDHDRRSPSLRRALAPPTVCLIGALSCCSLTGSAGGKMLSYIARASRIKRARSRSDFGENRTISPMFAPHGGAVRLPTRSCTPLGFSASSSRSSQCFGCIDMRSFHSSPLVVVSKGLELTDNRSVCHGFGSAEQSPCCL